MLKRLHLLNLFIACLSCATAAHSQEPREFAEQDIEFFETEVNPLLVEHCFDCHGGEDTQAGLNLTSRAGVLRGGDTGPAVDLNDPLTGPLIESVKYELYEMPPSGRLPEEQITLIEKWIKLGLPWTLRQSSAPLAVVEEREGVMSAADREHWAFQPILRPKTPDVANTSWVTNPSDAFILARLESAGLSPAPPAKKEALLRRATYDLTGLPPTAEEMAAFLADEASDAFVRVVDRLLASPHYGEKWGRHWLDLVRYAESNSYERDAAKPHVWRYRDYVIDSFNKDKPFDRFTQEQLAGDELPNADAESLVATGYYRLGLWDDEPVDQEQALYDGLDDVVKTTSQAFLGLTLDCARCHEHKLDPIPQRDYYRFVAFFQGMNPYGTRGGGSVPQNSVRPLATKEQAEQQSEAVKAYETTLAEVVSRIEQIEAKVRPDFAPVEVEEFKYERNRIALITKRAGSVISAEESNEYRKLVKQRVKLLREPPKQLAQALCVTEHGRNPRQTHVLIRGNAHAKGEEVLPGFPEVLGFSDPAIPVAPDGSKTCGRRSVLADWIVRADNPLTARVLANRMWQYHFGRGIVRSPNNFGLKGDSPTHPQLLDWLAAELISGEWRLKRVHRLIMLSSTYRMSSRGDRQALDSDPLNDLFWRFDMRRLAAEEIRDSILTVNGTLNSRMGGPSIYIKLPEAVLAGQSRPGAGWGNSAPDEQRRRSVYIHVKRSLRPPLMELFDGPDTDNTCPARFVTTQPTQALTMLNGAFLGEQSRHLAQFVKANAGHDTQAQVSFVISRVFQRAPLPSEIDRGRKLLQSMKSSHGLTDDEALDKYCLLVLNLNEFIYLD